jgi:cation-transporting ATPase 13A3/4/5
MIKDGPLIVKPDEIDCIMHEDIEEEASITSLTLMKSDTFRSLIFWSLVLLSGGIFYLICYWFPNIQIKFTYTRCPVEEATHIWAISKHFSDFSKLSRVSTTRESLIVFHYQQLPYFYDGQKFVPLAFDFHLTYKNLIDRHGQGISDLSHVEENRALFGICLILVPVMPLFKMIVTEIFHPFYVFQVYSVLLWYFDNYELYATAIVIITVISLTSSIVTTRRGQIALYQLARKECNVKVVRDGGVKEIKSLELVPGDLIEIEGEIELPCDLCLISGGCIVEEGMLTGESVPVIKDSLGYLDDLVYNPDTDKRHTLYEGTKIIQTRNFSGNPVRAVVVRTGFKTVKGRLVRSIMYPKPNKFKFYEDSLKFIVFLAFLTIVGFVVTIPRMIYLEYESSDLALRVLDLITITVPPALPACMAAGIAFAISRLKKERIFCISPNRVNVAGRIDMMVFDKTGTLTEDGMDLMGIQVFNSEERKMEKLTPEPGPGSETLVEGMACCHSLAVIDKKLMGDTQDLQIFRATGWTYEEPDEENYDPLVKAVVKPKQQTSSNDLISPGEQITGMIDFGYELGILHTFHFSSKLKRMGVIVKNLGSQNVIYYSKGAPEVILEKCVDIPKDINSVLANYTKKGYRVLACAYKHLEQFKYVNMASMKMEDVEKNMKFVGLIILQNKLKPETIPSLQKLTKAGILSLMATGDAVLTGISVSRESGLIKSNIPVYLGELDKDDITWELFLADEASKTTKLKRPPWIEHAFSDDYVLAVTGTAFAELVSRAEDSENETKTLQVVLEKCRIYARMAPEHKTLLVEKLQNLNYLVGMCGDGANDCGALKTADIGISLSEADSSIAAPFTSQIPNISSVLTVLVEGRCALTTSIQSFKFMALYSMIQFTSVSFLYWYYGNLTDPQFLLFDLFTVLPLSIFMSMTGPLKKLSPHQPPSELISLRILSSIIFQSLIQAIFQFLAFIIAVYTYYEWPDIKPGVDPGMINYTNTIITLTSWAQYQIVCASFSIGKPWKKPSYQNFLFTGFQIVLCTALFFCIFFYDGTLRDLVDVRVI